MRKSKDGNGDAPISGMRGNSRNIEDGRWCGKEMQRRRLSSLSRDNSPETDQREAAEDATTEAEAGPAEATEEATAEETAELSPAVPSDERKTTRKNY